MFCFVMGSNITIARHFLEVAKRTITDRTKIFYARSAVRLTNMSQVRFRGKLIHNEIFLEVFLAKEKMQVAGSNLARKY